MQKITIYNREKKIYQRKNMVDEFERAANFENVADKPNTLLKIDISVAVPGEK